ncbi:DMT family transporter [Roseovarius amoyensis]|uniref:DMT family transporter n=1 Tax=Roseovarius amoyensis TaxID=2211448 RepID=UPI000DBE5E38|nr:DMT family transporter [Roseovarius amoyensis]
MEAWVALSIVAAAFQTLRFMLQKLLSMGALSAAGATYARFAYAAPVALILAAGYLAWLCQALPPLTALFWLYAAIGGLMQILATWCVVLLFARRSFAVGITFKKTEVIQTALVGFVVLGDRISLPALGAIVLGLWGVLVLSDMPGLAGGLLRRLWNRSAGLGLASGALFAVSAVSYRGATLEVASEDAFLRATVAVAAVTLMQTVGMGLWLARAEPGQLARIWGARRQGVWMGLAGLGGSVGWFTAFTLQNAAYVFAVGQVELIFSLLASVLFFRERVACREYVGIALLAASILGLVLLG